MLSHVSAKSPSLRPQTQMLDPVRRVRAESPFKHPGLTSPGKRPSKRKRQWVSLPSFVIIRWFGVCSHCFCSAPVHTAAPSGEDPCFAVLALGFCLCVCPYVEPNPLWNRALQARLEGAALEQAGHEGVGGLGSGLREDSLEACKAQNPARRRYQAAKDVLAQAREELR